MSAYSGRQVEERGCYLPLSLITLLIIIGKFPLQSCIQFLILKSCTSYRTPNCSPQNKIHVIPACHQQNFELNLAVACMRTLQVHVVIKTIIICLYNWLDGTVLEAEGTSDLCDSLPTANTFHKGIWRGSKVRTSFTQNEARSGTAESLMFGHEVLIVLQSRILMLPASHDHWHVQRLGIALCHFFSNEGAGCCWLEWRILWTTEAAMCSTCMSSHAWHPAWQRGLLRGRLFHHQWFYWWQP